MREAFFILATLHFSGCSAVGSVPRSGRGGRWFESSHPDLTGQLNNLIGLSIFISPCKPCQACNMQKYLIYFLGSKCLIFVIIEYSIRKNQFLNFLFY